MIGVLRRVSLLAVNYPLGLVEISLPPQKIFKRRFPGRGKAEARTAVSTLLASK